MKLDKLRELVEIHKNDINYQHKDLDSQTFLRNAVISFQRLPEAQQAKVIQSWQTAIGSEGKISDQDLYELVSIRYLAQTNLFFLCKLLEKYGQVTVQTHEDICNKFFVRKDPTFNDFEVFADQYTDLKDRLLLVPRNGFKSSIDMADCIQYIICWPAITILILTGTLKLATDFVGEIKQHFTLEENGIPDTKTGKTGWGPRQLQDKQTRDWTDSMFQVLFPEHCTPPGEGKQTEFQTPAGGDQKEKTIEASSIEQALSGAHYEVIKMDDVVTNENSLNVDRIDKINAQISINRAMVNPYGFVDTIGTWYDERDYYGKTIKQEHQQAVELGLLDNIKGSVDSGIFNSNVEVKVYLRSAWVLKPGKIAEEAKKDDWNLWFPERMSYEWLLKEQRKDPDGFVIKYINNPKQRHNVKFPRELLVKRTIPHTQFPPEGVIVTTVDTAYSTKSWADFTVIMTALIYGGRFYIINMVRGRFNEYELPQVIASVAYKWKPKRIAIEDSVGVKWMGRELRREMDRLQISIPVEFCTLGLGSKSNSKKLKAKPVLRLLGDERMFFFNSCEGLEEIYKEMEQFTGTSEDKHDDIVSAISLLVEQFGGWADMGKRINYVDTQYATNKMDREMHSLIYGMGKYAKYNANNLNQDDNPVTAYQVGNATNSNIQENGPWTSIDPLAEAGI